MRLDWSMFWKAVLIAAAILWLVFVFSPGHGGSSGSDCPASAYPEDC